MAKKFNKKIKQIKKQGEEMIRKYGWIIHHIIDNGSHTHGLQENFNHPELEITLNLPADVSHNILTIIANNIKHGQKYNDGQKYHEIIENFPVSFHLTDNNILRIILPDPNGLFPGDKGCQKPFSLQKSQLRLVTPDESTTQEQ